MRTVFLDAKAAFLVDGQKKHVFVRLCITLSYGHQYLEHLAVRTAGRLQNINPRKIRLPVFMRVRACVRVCMHVRLS